MSCRPSGCGWQRSRVELTPDGGVSSEECFAMHRIAIVCVGSLLVSPMLAGQQRGSVPKMDPAKFLTQPPVTDIYTADPSAHAFNGKIFIYPSHDTDAAV